MHSLPQDGIGVAYMHDDCCRFYSLLVWKVLTEPRVLATDVVKLYSELRTKKKKRSVTFYVSLVLNIRIIFTLLKPIDHTHSFDLFMMVLMFKSPNLIFCFLFPSVTHTLYLFCDFIWLFFTLICVI